MFVENFKNHSAAEASFFKDVASVQKVTEARLPTETGEFRIAGYRSLISDEEFIVLY